MYSESHILVKAPLLRRHNISVCTIPCIRFYCEWVKSLQYATPGLSITFLCGKIGLLSFRYKFGAV